MDEWECMLSDIFDCVLRHLDTEDVKHSRLVCTTWREEVDSLISTMTLKGPLHVPNMVSRFQASPNPESLARPANSDLSGSQCSSLQACYTLEVSALGNNLYCFRFCVCNGHQTYYIRACHCIPKPEHSATSAALQGLTEVILSFATEEEFTSDLWHPLRGLKRLQSLTLDNRGPVQPTILGLEELHDTSITTLRMKGCLICIACGIDYLTQLTIVELHHCILMLVRYSNMALLTLCAVDSMACQGSCYSEG